MSFILDALKKSETDRQQQGSAEFAGVPTSNRREKPPRWLWVLGLLLAVNVVVLLGLLLRPDAQPAVSPAAQPAQTTQAAPPKTRILPARLQLQGKTPRPAKNLARPPRHRRQQYRRSLQQSSRRQLSTRMPCRRFTSCSLTAQSHCPNCTSMCMSTAR